MFNKKNKLQHSVTLATMIMLSGLSVSAWADQYEDAAGLRHEDACEYDVLFLFLGPVGVTILARNVRPVSFSFVQSQCSFCSSVQYFLFIIVQL